MSKVFSKAGDPDNAVINQQRAFDTFAKLDKYSETDYLADMA